MYIKHGNDIINISNKSISVEGKALIIENNLLPIIITLVSEDYAHYVFTCIVDRLHAEGKIIDIPEAK